MEEANETRAEHVRSALERILAFPDMKASRRLSAFLRFVVEEALAGRRDRIKERTVAIGALGRDASFDARLDAAVRIAAGRLRRTMQRYYFSDGESDPLRIVIPKGSYCPQFLTREEALCAAPATGDAVHDAEPAPRSHDPTPRAAEMEIEVIVADDHEMFRKGLLLLLQEEDSVTVVGEASDGRSAIDLTRKLSPDVVVMDVTMPGVNGAEATRRILAESPDVKIIALSVHSGKRFVENMLSAGAAGYVLKEGAPKELVSAIQRAMRGEVYLSAAITNVVVSQYVGSLSKAQATPEPVQLTQKESDALRLIVEGHSVEQMASALQVTKRTVTSMQHRLMKKLGVNSLEGLEAYAQAIEAPSECRDASDSPGM